MEKFMPCSDINTDRLKKPILGSIVQFLGPLQRRFQRSPPHGRASKQTLSGFIEFQNLARLARWYALVAAAKGDDTRLKFCWASEQWQLVRNGRPAVNSLTGFQTAVSGGGLVMANADDQGGRSGGKVDLEERIGRILTHRNRRGGIIFEKAANATSRFRLVTLVMQALMTSRLSGRRPLMVTRGSTVQVQHGSGVRHLGGVIGVQGFFRLRWSASFDWFPVHGIGQQQC
jgi:hypothetical protein